jgi:hypothetical protein
MGLVHGLDLTVRSLKTFVACLLVAARISRQTPRKAGMKGKRADYSAQDRRTNSSGVKVRISEYWTKWRVL